MNSLIFVSLRNSRKEVLVIIGTLSRMYANNDLGEYFGTEKAIYYEKRYNLWLLLVPALMVFALTVSVAIEYAT